MTVLELIRGRRTVHKYRAEPVPPEVIEAALEAAHHAPCHKLTWPWRFTVVEGAARRDITEIIVQVKAPPTAEMEAKVRAKVGNPGALVVVSLLRCADAFRAREDYAAAACAIQNLQLAVHAAGYAAKWSTGGPTRAPQTYARLGIDALLEEIIGFVWIGVPAEVPTINRPPVATVVRRID